MQAVVVVVSVFSFGLHPKTTSPESGLAAAGRPTALRATVLYFHHIFFIHLQQPAIMATRKLAVRAINVQKPDLITPRNTNLPCDLPLVATPASLTADRRYPHLLIGHEVFKPKKCTQSTLAGTSAETVRWRRENPSAN